MTNMHKSLVSKQNVTYNEAKVIAIGTKIKTMKKHVITPNIYKKLKYTTNGYNKYTHRQSTYKNTCN